MDVPAIRAKIKDLVSKVTEIDVADISDNASFVDDLQLDSLSLLEIGVEVDYEFKLGVPEERLAELATIQDSVDLVIETLAGTPTHAEVA